MVVCGGDGVPILVKVHMDELMEIHQEPQFMDSTYFKVGNGVHLKFWHHQWCGETSLRSRFPELFHLASHPEASIKDLTCLRVLTSIGM